MSDVEPGFKVFESSLRGARARLSRGQDTKAFLRQQKRQVEELVRLERRFRRDLQHHPWGETVYREFVDFINLERHNILDARQYFRERQGVFNTRISHVFSALDHTKHAPQGTVRDLYQFHFNFRFVQFALRAKKWNKDSKIRKTAQQIQNLRHDLTTLNMPLAISRARIFFSRTPRAHLTYMDMVQIAAEALMAGIDKFVGPYSRAFRGVAIGRMTGNFIEQYSETAIHFWPKDKRLLYRANKLVGRQPPGTVDHEVLATKVSLVGAKKDAEKGVVSHAVSGSELQDLMAAASTVSMTKPPNEEDEGSNWDGEGRFAAPEDTQPDVRVEAREAQEAMYAAAPWCLDPLDRKLLILKGVDLPVR